MAKESWLFNKGDLQRQFGIAMPNLTPLENQIIKLTAKKIAERFRQYCLGETRSSYHFEIPIKEWHSLLKEIEES